MSAIQSQMTVQGRPPLALVSRSPHRRALLTSAGFAHEVLRPTFDDARLRPGGGGPEAWVSALAYLKAETARRRGGLDPGALLIGADTVVVKHGEIIGQPESRREADHILRLLEGGRHVVMTGVALVCASNTRRIIFTDVAEVRVGALGAERIEPYLDSGAWRGKAGAYNLRERLDDGWPLAYEGDPATIMGLPMRRLTPLLTRLGWPPEPGLRPDA